MRLDRDVEREVGRRAAAASRAVGRVVDPREFLRAVFLGAALPLRIADPMLRVSLSAVPVRRRRRERRRPTT